MTVILDLAPHNLVTATSMSEDFMLENHFDNSGVWNEFYQDP